MKKKLLISIVSLCVMLSMSVSAFGATSYTVSLSTIDSIVSSNSSYAKDALAKIADEQTNYNRLTIKIAKENANISDNQIKISKLDPNAENYDKQLSDLQDDIKTSQDAIKSYNTARNASVYSMNQISIDNNISIIQQGENAKEEYIKYLDAVNAKKSLLASIAKEKKKVLIAKLKFKKGIISKNALATEVQALEDLEDQMDDADALISDEYVSLIEALGVADDSTLTVSQLSGEDKAAFVAAKNYNYSADLASVLANSLEIKKDSATVSYDLSLVNSAIDADSRTEAIDTYTKAVAAHQALITKTTKSFKKQYDSLQRAVKSVQKNDRKVTRAKSAMKTAKKKYNYGLISRNEYQTSIDAYKSAVATGNKAITELFPQILKYQLTVKGY